jgi:aspartokinase-like uncharacterized kinase
MSSCRICVAKVGGSLLSRPDLASQLRNWLNEELTTHVNTHYVLVVGGGRLVDAIREIDAMTSLGDATVHWICIELMDVTSRILSNLIPELTVVDRFRHLAERTAQPGITLFCPAEFMTKIEPNSAGTRLPANWSVTSDSIAGRLAIVLAADELVVIKSAAPPPIPESIREKWLGDLAAQGYVDRFLPDLAHELPPARCAVFNRPLS